MNTIYLAHKDEERIQSLDEHLDGTARLAQEFGRPFHWEKECFLLGKNHDLGKFSNLFQEYIRGKRRSGGDHSTAGAKFLWSLKDQLQVLYKIGAFCISGHHTGLPDEGSSMDLEGESTLYGRMKKKLPHESQLMTHAYLDSPYDIRHLECFGAAPIDRMLLTRMMFSCLVDADFLDTEHFMTGPVPRGQFPEMDELHQRFFTSLKEKGFLSPKNEINQKRYEILSTCINKGKGPAGLYSLTVPTGGGKTISSFAFAMNQAKYNKKRRIIYIIPYLSIIEQTAVILKNFLGNGAVLESHSSVNYDDAGKDAEKMKLASENWDAPVIVTTNVQFWESLYSNRTSKCRKLHNLQGSVLILDEAQMLPLGFLKPCLEALQELVSYYSCTVILCSATQPELGKYMKRKPVEIIDHIPELYQFFQRVTYHWDGEKNYDEITEAMMRHKQALCIASTKKEAREFFSRLSQKQNDTFYLSTNLCPTHRKIVIDKIKQRLHDDLPCYVVSTCIISVGVDLDFPVVYLEYSGLDSLIQGAGRCNREGKHSAEESIAHVFWTEKSMKSRFMGKEKQVTNTIHRIFSDKTISTPEAINKYYRLWYLSNEGNMDKENILEKSKSFQFKQIANDFKLIKDDTKSVFISYNAEAEIIKKELMQGIRGRDLMRRAGRYMVNVLYSSDSHQESDYSRLLGQGKIMSFPGDSELAYLVDPNGYDDRMGLLVSEEDGQSIMW
ncbi:CRISPR-associated helicase Cas3' [Dialister sp.]|uniref:CRISPR-associated helicase Cas3' n=1 Tax=Dialister sp. TaxID=1955814 RepID=UPI003F0F96D7